MARITKTVDIPIKADESAFSLFDVMRIIKKGVADVINAKVAKAGGFYGVKKWAAVAESAGLATVVGTDWGIGSQIAAKLCLGGIHQDHPPRHRVHGDHDSRTALEGAAPTARRLYRCAG